MAAQPAPRPVRRDRHYDRLVSLRMSSDQLDRLDRLCDELERPRNALLREGVDLVLRLRGVSA